MVRLPRAVLLAVAGGIAMALAPAALAGVRVVGQGQPYSQISAAVAAANDGDVILVKSGAYAGFTIGNKSVAVVAETGAVVYIDGTITIENLAPNKTVVLDRLNLTNIGVGSLDGLRVLNCAGAVRVQGCDFTAYDATASINHQTCNTVGEKDGGTAILLQGAFDVALVFCRGYGGQGAFLWDYECYMSSFNPQIGGNGGAGLEVSASRVAVYDGTFEGGDAGSGAYAGNAGPGILATNGSSVMLVNTVATGGNGALNQDPLTSGNGAHGVSAYAFDDVWILDSQFEAGNGPGGQPAVFDAPPTWLAGQAKPLGFFKLLREGQSTPIQVSGEPGDLVMLMAATKSSPHTFPQFKGTFLLDPSPLLGPFVIGVIPQDVLTVNVTMPQLPAVLPALEVYLQGLVKSSGGSSTLTSWGHLTVLDSAY